MLGGRGDDAYHDPLGTAALLGTVASSDVAAHDSRANTLLGVLVRCIDVVVVEEGGHGRCFPLQVGQELVYLFAARLGPAERFQPLS